MFQEWIMQYIIPYLIDVETLRGVNLTIPLLEVQVNAFDVLHIALAGVLFVVSVRLVYAIWKPLARLLKVDKPIGKR